MADNGDMGNVPNLPEGNNGGGGKNVLRKRDYDILDPEAKTQKNMGERIDDVKQTAENAKKVVQVLAKIPWPVWVVIIIIIIVVGIIAFLLTIPGLAIANLKAIAQGAVDTVQSWFTTAADAHINAEDVVELANYLEELDYDLVGYGFIVPNTTAINIAGYKTYEELIGEGYELLRNEDDTGYIYYDSDGNAYDGYYYNSLGILIDNSTGQMVDTETYIDQYGVLRSTEEMNSDGVGEIVSFGDDWLDTLLDFNVDTTLLRSYLLSDYRIYAIRNKDEGTLSDLWTAIKQTFGGYDSAWSKGLMKIYYAQDGIAIDEWSSAFDSFVYGDNVKVNGTNLEITNGRFNNKVTFDIEGWADRYGMSLEFLLSLHIATMAPDLVYSMLQNFDTEVQVYFDDSGDSEVEASYVDMMNEDATIENGITFSDVKETLAEQGGIDLNDWLVNATYYGYSLSSLGISKADAQYLLDNLPLESPPNCTGSAEVDIILKSTYKDTHWWTRDDLLSRYSIDSASSDGNNSDFTLGDEAASLTLEDRDVEVEEGDYVDFNAANCTYDLGNDEDAEIENDGYSATLSEIIDDNNYKFFYDTGYALGYTDDTTAVSVNTTTQSAEDVDAGFFDGDVFDIDAVKQVRTWTATARDADGNEIVDDDGETEEVEYEWVTYKFVVYKVGTDYNPLASGYTELDEPELVAVVIWEYIIRDETYDELLESGAIDSDGNEIERSGVCSAVNGGDYGSVQTKCCKNCQKYVKRVIIALAQVTDSDYEFYTPYIARVVGSWFRDTYFVIPDEDYVGGKGGAEDNRYDHNGDGPYNINDLDEAIEYNNQILTDIDEATGELYTENDDEIVDIAIYDYYYEASRSDSETSMLKNSYGSNSTLVIVDEEYLADTGEYWTAYEMVKDADGNDTDEYQLYYLNPDGTTSDIKMETYLSDNGYSSQEEAEEAGIAFVKKAKTRTVTDISNASEEENVIWQAYSFDTNGAVTGWIKIERADGNDEVNKVYDIIGDNAVNEDGGFYYNITSTNSITQVEDAQRSETNATIKYMFKYRKYYIYDGTEETAEAIAEDKEIVLEWAKSYLRSQGYSASDIAHLLGKYGRSALRQTYSWSTISLDWDDVAEQWLSWQLDMYYSGITNDCPDGDILITDDLAYRVVTDDDGNIESIEAISADEATEDDRVGDPRNPDLIATVNITKTSLNAFSILENTKTLAAEYSYRDFKELIVELDYFDKEDLSDAISEVFTWILPDVSPAGSSSESSSSSSSTVDESKIYFLGDSWINALNGKSFVESTYINGIDGVTASRFIGQNIVVDSDVSAIVIHLGMNGTSTYGDTQTLIEELMNNNPNVPIYVLAVCHVADGAATSVTNEDIDSYNSEMRSYCSGTSGVTYIDPTTDLVGDDGYLKTEYEGYGGYHVNDTGCEVWYNAIISGISGSSSDSGESTSSSGAGWPVRPWDKQDNDYGALIHSAQTYDYLEDTNYQVDDDDEEDEEDTTSETDTDSEGNQTILDQAQEILDVMVEEDWDYQSGCWADGLTTWEIAQSSGSKVSSCDTYVSWVLQEAGYLGEGKRLCHKSYGDSGESIKEAYGDNLNDATWYFPDCTTSDYDLVPGDVVIIENGDWQSIGIYAGQNDSGDNLYYGALSENLVDRIVSEGGPITFNSFDSGNLVAVVRFSGGSSTSTSSSFEGWEEGDYVSSPVTGKVLEYGIHTRTNVYTEEEEEVGYIVIEAMSSKYFTEDNVATNSGDTEDLSNSDVMEGLNYFYDEYEDTCSGYVIMIDGFDVDLNLVDESDARGSYEQNEIYALYDSSEQSKRELQEQAKDDAPFVVVIGDDYEIDNFPTQEDGYVSSDTDDYAIYIKEGKYIGTCVSTYGETDDAADDTTDDTNNTEDTADEVDETEETTNDYDGPAEYIRIMLKNMEDYSIVDNVEDYFNIPEIEESSSSGNILPGNTTEEKVWNALIQAGYSEIATAAAMGNIYGESGFDSSAIESNGEGYGLCQWSYGRKTQLLAFADSRGVDWTDVDLQIEFLLGELGVDGYAEGYATYQFSGFESYESEWKNSSSIDASTTAFCAGFERPSVPRNQARIDAAQGYYDTYGSGN